MSQKYQLTCSSCGHLHHVEVSQAGQQLHCQCGQTIEVPTFRELKQLPAVSVADARSELDQPRSWHPLQGTLFLIGMLLVALGLGGAAYVQSYRMSLDTEEKQYDDLDRALGIIEGLNPEESLKAWQQIREQGIGPRNPPDFVLARQIKSKLLLVVYVLLASVAVGAVLLGLSFVIKPSRGQPATK